MSEEIKKLDEEIQKRFQVSGKSEFILSDKYRLTVSDCFGKGVPSVDVMDLENPNKGSLPLEYVEPEVLKIIQDNFAFTSPETNPFMQDLEDDEDGVDQNPFMD